MVAHGFASFSEGFVIAEIGERLRSLGEMIRRAEKVLSLVTDRDVGDLIVSRSGEMKLTVRPIRVRVTEKDRHQAREWISQLPDEGPVKMLLGRTLEDKRFLDPSSPAGRLRREHRRAIPDLVDAALDPKLTPGRRAWVLGLLFAITGHNDPRELGHPLAELITRMSERREGTILGPYKYEGEGTGSRRQGEIDPVKQREFAERWRVWKEKGYYVVEDG